METIEKFEHIERRKLMMVRMVPHRRNEEKRKEKEGGRRKKLIVDFVFVLLKNKLNITKILCAELE